MRKILVKTLLGLLITAISVFSTAKTLSKTQLYSNKKTTVTFDWHLTLSKHNVIVTDTITNHLLHPIYLPPDAMPIAVYRIRDNFELPIIGLQISRTPYRLDEFIKILPQKSHTFEYKLNETYGFPQGCYDYQMKIAHGYFYLNNKNFLDLGNESQNFTWCNPIDPFHGQYKDPLKK